MWRDREKNEQKLYVELVSGGGCTGGGAGGRQGHPGKRSFEVFIRVTGEGTGSNRYITGPRQKLPIVGWEGKAEWKGRQGVDYSESRHE